MSELNVDGEVQEVDVLTLRFTGEEEDGSAIHELRAAHVAEVLQGLVGLASDFDKAGAFNPDAPGQSEVLVRPAEEGSFLIEVVRVIQDIAGTYGTVAAVTGVPTLGAVILMSTKSARADVKDFTYLPNGNVKVVWQDDTSHEVTVETWNELNKRKRRRKKQLREIMAPLSDPRVSALEVASAPAEDNGAANAAPQGYTLTRPDYDAVRPEDEIYETHTIFDVEAQMSAIDFDDPSRWRVKTANRNRNAAVEDQDFLDKVANGLAIRKSDLFDLRIREDAVEKNGRTTTSWTVLRVGNHTRVANDDNPSSDRTAPSS